MASLLGINGNISKGTDRLTGFLNSHQSGQMMYHETLLYTIYVLFYISGGQQEAWQLLTGNQYIIKDNPLNTFVKTTIALDYRKADTALAALSALGQTDFEHYPCFYFLKGAALFCRYDLKSNDYFRFYIENNHNNMFVKNSWQRMAICWYMADNMPMAEYCRRQISTHGDNRLDADKQADKFASQNHWPPRPLLAGRLLTDGGYYKEAFDALKSISPEGLAYHDKPEYYYRLGRVYQELEDHNHALEYYGFAISAGKKSHEQYAARAALQTGLIYEHSGKPAAAIAMYKACLDMPAHDFQNNIDQQAKAGISRLGQILR